VTASGDATNLPATGAGPSPAAASADPKGEKPQNPSKGDDSCATNSVAAGSEVLMADGSRKAMEQVRAGDQVTATVVRESRPGDASAVPQRRLQEDAGQNHNKIKKYFE
jgi:hypothetical protein